MKVMALIYCKGKVSLPELKKANTADLETYLRAYGLIGEMEKILSLSSIGRTSMNSTVKIQSESHSMILKKARTWVENYPTIPAPGNLYKYDHGYFELLEKVPSLSAFSPNVLALDPNAKVLIQEDLGSMTDSFSLFQQKPLTADFITQLVNYLKTLHKVDLSSLPEEFQKLFPANYFSKELFFVIPFSPSLSHLFRPEMDLVEDIYILQANRKFKEKLNFIAEEFDKNLNVLSHGSYHPGNWLNVGGKLKVINFEFAHTAPSEYDLGGLLACLLIGGCENQVSSVINEFKETDTLYKKDIIQNYASIEILRRMVGYGNLMKPVPAKLRKSLLERATKNLTEDGNLF